MSLSRIWIVHPKLSPALSNQGEIARFRKAEVKVVPTLAALAEEVDHAERLILLAPQDVVLEAQSAYQERILASRSLPPEPAIDTLLVYLEAVLADSILQHDLEVLELNAWTGLRTGKYDEPAMEFLGKTVLEISSCRDLEEVEEVLLHACVRLAPVTEVVVAHSPPHLSSKILGHYQLAVPINFNTELKAHVYVRFAIRQNSESIESVGELILNLSDIIALSVERNRIISKAEQTKLIWEASFNAVEDPVVILNEKLEIVRANKAYGSLLQAPVARLIGKRIPVDLFPEPSDLNFLRASQEWDTQLGAHWYRIHFDPITMPFGAGRSVLRLRNISAERSLTEKILAREQGAELGILVGSVAHEINNPIGGILALSQILLKDLPSDSALHQDLANISNAAERCRKIVQTMLSLVRKTGDIRAAFDLGESIKASLELVSSELQRLGLKVQLQGFEQQAPLLGNRNRIMQACFHILQGALQALEERAQNEKFRAQLKIELHSRDDRYELSFTDNGLARTHEHDLRHSVSYAVAQILLEEHQGSLSVKQSGEWNSQTMTLPQNALDIPS